MKNSLLFACIVLALIAFVSCSEANTNETQTVKKQKSVFSAFAQSFSSIVVSELGDKTFFIAAIMAMRYNRIAVLSGALVALFLMTAISTAFGTIVPTILPQSVTHILITFLFFFFGGKLLYDAYNDDGEESNEQAEVEIELNQVHAKLMKSAGNSRQEVQIQDLSNEADSIDLSENKNENPNKSVNCATKIEEVATKMVFWQALTMTFLGEWGDRSQISTIALAAESSATFVFIGAFLGHVLCTTLAVIGGKFLAKKISERTVNICGGILFLMFGLHNLFFR